MSAAVPAFRVERIGAAVRLRALEAPWSGLLERSRTATPFHAPEWILAWWNRFAPGDLFCLALWDERRLAGIAPLYVSSGARSAPRRLSLIGTGITDYMGFLVEDPAAREGTRALLGYLGRHRSHWNVCDFEQLAPGDPLLDLAAGVTGEVTAQVPCAVVDLPESTEAFDATLSPRFCSRLRGRYPRRLAALGEVSIGLADESTLGEHLDALFALHESRRTSMGLPSGLSGEGMRAFHEDVARAFLRRGWLRLYGLRVGSALGAVMYVLHHRRRAFAYLSGFDPELASFSPGMVLVDHAIRGAIHEGVTQFDFLRGREAYKRLWGARDRWNSRLVIHARAAMGVGATTRVAAPPRDGRRGIDAG